MGYIENLMVDFKRICIHESGHVVMALALGKKFDYVTVNPHRDYNGAVFGIERNHLLEDALISSGGIYAESIYFNGNYHVDNGAQTDCKQIDAVLSKIYGPHALTYGHNEVREKAMQLLRENWKMVTTIAQALEVKKQMTFDEVKNLI